jgi:hypothetical protein
MGMVRPILFGPHTISFAQPGSNPCSARISWTGSWLDGNSLDLRPRGGEPRKFNILVLLAAKKLYGGTDDRVDRALLVGRVYGSAGVNNAEVSARRAVESINRQAERATRGAVKALVVLEGTSYRIRDGVLDPPDYTIQIVGDLKPYLRQKMNVELQHFPLL